MEEKQYAVLIGTGSYPAEPGLHPLRCATRDVDGWEALLTNPARGAFHKVTALKDRPSHEITRAINRTLNELTKDDVLLLFYSGHGKQNLAGDLFLAATDTEVSMLSTTAVPVKAIRDLLNESPCRKIVFILDCCFSGAAGAAFTKGSMDDQIKAVGRASGTYVLTASSAVQTALEKEADEHSVFTKHLLKGIETGAADRSGTGFVTVDDMFEYARLEVMKESHQEPTLWALNKQDNVRIAKSGREPRAERAGKIRKRLYELAADARIPDELIPEARRILETSPEKQTKKEQRRDELLDRLIRNDVGAAVFAMEWGSLETVSATGTTTPPMPIPPVAPVREKPQGAAKAPPVDPSKQTVSLPPIASAKWKRPVLAALVAAVVLGAGFFFGLHQPAQRAKEVARLEKERMLAAQKAEQEKKNYDAIRAEIAALVDGSTLAQRAAVEATVTKYQSSAPPNYRAGVEAQWKDRLAGLATADQLAAQKAAQERKSHDAIVAEIAALVDGSALTRRAAVETAVRDYLAGAPANYRAEVETLWKDRLTRLEAARVEAARGGIIVKSVPAGAEVTVGALEYGVSPLTVKEAKLGKYPVRMKLAGYEDYSGEVEVKENVFSEVSAVLVRSTGSVAIRSKPAELGYVLVGKERTERGQTPASHEQVPTGDYALTVTRAGWPEQKQTVRVKRNEGTAAQVEFAGGNVELTSRPSGAEVYVDGKKIGETPLSYRDLPPSSYAYEFRLKGYKSASVRGEINAGETARAHGVMEQIRGPESGQAWTVPELGLVLQPIAAGTFLMESEQGASEEKPVTRVTITKPYWLGATEVTQSQYEAVMGNNPSDFRGANLPVEQVTWEEAMEFGRKVTQRERAAGRLPSGYVYTLPSEAQWEYGCRAGTTGDYAGDLNTMGWYNENSGGTTHAVGTKRANGWGLSDMHGNVFEWCADWYGAYLGGSVSDPKGAPAGTFRVLRGGGWSHDAAYCRSAYRYWCGPGFRNNYIGFRLALSSAP